MKWVVTQYHPLERTAIGKGSPWVNRRDDGVKILQPYSSEGQLV